MILVTKKNKSAIQRRLIPTYIFLIIVSFFSVFPLYWMISAATNTSTDVSRGRIIPGSYFMENFKNLTSQQPLWRALGNSFFYAILTTVICLWSVPSPDTDSKYIMTKEKTNCFPFSFLPWWFLRLLLWFRCLRCSQKRSFWIHPSDLSFRSFPHRLWSWCSARMQEHSR